MDQGKPIDRQRLFAKTLFIPTNGNSIAASGSRSFFVARWGDTSQNKFARGCLEGGEGSKMVVGDSGGLHFFKKVWGGFGLVWFL